MMLTRPFCPNGPTVTLIDMGRISNTIRLARESWEVLKADKELMWLPVLSFVASVGAVVVLGVPYLVTTDFGDSPGAVGVILGVLLSIALSFIQVFFQGALVSGANERLTGGDPTVRSSISGATGRIHRLVPWALMVVTVNLVLRAVEERVPSVGRLLAGLASSAWAVLTYLVMPVMIIEDVGPIDAVKKSSSLFRDTWGENLASQVGFGIVAFLAALPAMILFGIGVAIGGVAAVPLYVVAFGWVAVVLAAMSAMTAIFQTALYHYATEGRAPSGFDTGDIAGSFTRR